MSATQAVKALLFKYSEIINLRKESIKLTFKLFLVI